ncbi:hypothetical protein [Pseudosulfitobacter pseudonitzschiae]|uniref:hypothetical protein n=1 Tax=Pseudosulfitobacter pseudonitzschiae TaxID=1402135 RepID=UPI003B77AD8E
MTISRSIYGVRIPGTIGDVIHQLDGLRPLMMRRSSEKIARAIARLASEAHDIDHLSNGKNGADYVSEAYQRILERQRRMDIDQTRDPMVDTSFDVVLRGEGHVVIMLSFTEHMEWFEELLSLPGAEDYSFWTGSTRPSDISEEDWEQRRKTYSRILARDPHGRAAGIGVTHSFQTSLERPSIDAIIENIPSLSDRADVAAFQVIFSRWLGSKEGGATHSERLAFMADLTSPDMQDTVARVARDIRPLLPELSPHLLTGEAQIKIDDLPAPEI